MNLNQSSLHARLYRFFYSTDTLPSNLCPYFWKLVVAYICIIPYFAIKYTLVPFFGTKVGLWCAYIIGSAMVLSFVGIICHANYHLVRYWLGCYSYDSHLATGAGVIDSYAIIIILFNVIKIKRKPKASQQQYIITEFAKARYNKYCPQIKWK